MSIPLAAALPSTPSPLDVTSDWDVVDFLRGFLVTVVLVVRLTLNWSRAVEKALLEVTSLNHSLMNL